jgi:GxxExxY protein
MVEPKQYDILKINQLTEQIIGAAIEVHRAFGPGLLESVYQDCMTVELKLRNLPFEPQKPVALAYKGFLVGTELKIDLLVANLVVVELKSVATLLPVHEAQLLTYLKLTKCPVGLLINFNVPILKRGIKRMLNTSFESETIETERNKKP